MEVGSIWEKSRNCVCKVVTKRIHVQQERGERLRFSKAHQVYHRIDHMIHI